MHTHTHTHTHAHTRTNARALSLTLSLIHARTSTHAHTHTHAHKHTPCIFKVWGRRDRQEMSPRVVCRKKAEPGQVFGTQAPGKPCDRQFVSAKLSHVHDAADVPVAA